MSWNLARHRSFAGVRGPVLLVILDGVGVGAGDEADAVRIAATPTLDRLWAPGARCTLQAHGTAVGLPSDDDMGNSEVGHNAMGAGRIYDQGAKLVDAAIASGRLFTGQVWGDVVARCVGNGAPLHFIGLLSDGNVHSHIDQLIALLRRAAADGVEQLFVHALLDGRDVPSHSALQYIDQLEEVLAELRSAGKTAAIASGGGRMKVTMDRYRADWDMVERGWQTHVRGDGRRFASARQAIETLREDNPGVDDQNLPAFVIAADGDGESRPLAPIEDGAAVVCFNFRGDRVIELSQAFDDDDFPFFDRGHRPDVLYAGMMEYDGDLHVPRHYLVEPPDIERTMGEYLVRNSVTQLAISETQKYGHVTYFWNGNRSGKFDDALETYVEIPSDRVEFSERPWMKAAEITDRLIAEIGRGEARFLRTNFANGDMVGHTGNFAATVIAVECIDLQLARLAAAIERAGGAMIVTADHGNADEMFQRDKRGAVQREWDGSPVMKTSHTLNPVPLTVFHPGRDDAYVVDPTVVDRPGLAHVTGTCLELLGFELPEDMLGSVLRFR